ncbi:uncharacterized protein LOC128550714 [Mercenaria mercenaria]|uniref:uncharacterized protein LOC128550714 n=1 Tax=Mercenaria mercenaria TaxID=6596 RepID=UPI00234F4514|nr:uncharacterized protein LOC128550714 [Mercenaria mercenaria]
MDSDFKSKCKNGCVLSCVCTVVTGVVMIYYFYQSISQTKYSSDIMEPPLPSFRHEKLQSDANNTMECQSCSVSVPNVILQYGHPRTATTLQFNILCLSMALLHEDVKNSVGCYYNKKKSKKYIVIKTHAIAKFLTKIPSHSWIFMTSKVKFSPKEKQRYSLTRQNIKVIRAKNITIKYVADINFVSKRGHSVVYEYQPIFGISDAKMQHMAEYFRYWDILRLCCGKQMSADWRNHLSLNPNYKRHHVHNSSIHSVCERYNISQVEVQFLNTYAFKTFAHIDSLRDVIGKPSTVDGKLDGSYCERCNANITHRSLKFNQKCA